VRERKIKKEET